jgi:hypothetical protein
MSQHIQDTQHLIGTLLGEGVGRDAIHIAVAPAVAGRRLLPAQRVELVDGKAVPATGDALGVVDPYLDVVMPGERFFIFLLPNTITSLRHAWTHPAFADEGAPERISDTDHKSKSKAWIVEHANALGLSADVLMEDAQEWLRYEEHTVQHGSERWRDTFNPTEFWHHYEIVTGAVVEAEKKRSFYCCAC